MSQCVPSWDLDDNPSPPPRFTLRAQSNSNSLGALDVPCRLDYEVTELTWKNGQLSMHGLGPPRVPSKIIAAAADAWPEKLPARDTLESIVDQATAVPLLKKATFDGVDGGGNELVPQFEDHRRRVCTAATAATAANSITMTMDALVPCNDGRTRSNHIHEHPSSAHVLESVPGIGTCVVGSSTRVGSCSGAPTMNEDVGLARVARGWNSRADLSVSGSATCGRDSRQVTLDTCEIEFGTAGFTSNSMGSPGNTSSAKQCTNTTTDDQDSVCHSRNQEDKKKGTGKAIGSTKRTRAAAIHNQSERKRRDKINQRMKTLQKLVPNSSKTDKASMLDEVIEYLKQLQAQVQLMRMNMSPLMLPLAMQQQLQMSMLAPMGMGMNMNMGMGLGHVMDLNTIGRPNIAGVPPLLYPSAFMPMAASWDAMAGDRLAPAAATSAMPDPLLAAFLSCQSQPMAMDAYSMMASLYQQQFQQPPGAASKSKMI